MKQITRVTIQELADKLENAFIAETVDLGSAVLNVCSDTVIGDFVALSLPDGSCAVIHN